jgi:hypothetical protein
MRTTIYRIENQIIEKITAKIYYYISPFGENFSEMEIPGDTNGHEE